MSPSPTIVPSATCAWPRSSRKSQDASAPESTRSYCRISSYLQSMANQGYNPLVAIQIASAPPPFAPHSRRPAPSSRCRLPRRPQPRRQPPPRRRPAAAVANVHRHRRLARRGLSARPRHSRVPRPRASLPPRALLPRPRRWAHRPVRPMSRVSFLRAVAAGFAAPAVARRQRPLAQVCDMGQFLAQFVSAPAQRLVLIRGGHDALSCLPVLYADRNPAISQPILKISKI